MEKAWKLVLNLFGEGASGGDGAAGGTTGDGAEQASGRQAWREGASPTSAGKSNGLPSVPGGEADGRSSDPSADRKATFRNMIKGEYKAEFDEVMQDNLKRRFRDHDDLKKRVDDTRPLMELLAGKYGVDAEDIAGIVKAAEADDGYYEQEAAEKGLTVAQLKDFKRMERENARLKAAADERQRVEGVNRVHAQWARESEELKAIYPNFDFDAETQNPTFSSLLQAGVGVRAAYETTHLDEIVSGAMQFTAQKAQQQTVNNIRARGMRPDEGGMGTRAAGEARLDVSKLTKKERAEYAARALRGERITFDGG